MTLWQLFNEHPLAGLIASVLLIVCVTSLFEQVIAAVSRVLVAKHGGCDCVPCDREHVCDEDEETEE